MANPLVLPNQETWAPENNAHLLSLAYVIAIHESNMGLNPI